MGSGIGGKGVPKPPDFTAAAEAQARGNHPNQNTPWASSTWTQASPASAGSGGGGGGSVVGGGSGPGGARAPGVGGWNLDLGPGVQGIPGRSGGGPNTVGGGSPAAGGGIDGQWTQNVTLAPGLDTASDNLMAQIAGQGPAMTGDQARAQAIDSAWNDSRSRLDPMWQQNETAIRSRLANQGLDMGSEAYGGAMGDFSRSQNDAYSQAMADAIRQGTAAQAVTFDQNQRALMSPYQQLSAIQGLAGMPAAPGGADYLGAAGLGYQGSLNQYGTQQAGKNSLLSGVAQAAPLLAAL